MGKSLSKIIPCCVDSPQQRDTSPDRSTTPVFDVSRHRSTNPDLPTGHQATSLEETSQDNGQPSVAAQTTRGAIQSIIERNRQQDASSSYRNTETPEVALRDLKTEHLKNAQENIWKGHLDEWKVAHLMKTDEEIPESLRLLESGGTKPMKVTLKCGIVGVFKGEKSSGSEGKYKSEIAAYKLDRLLGLNMVPLTVKRKIIDGKGVEEEGSFQLWVKNLDESCPNVLLPANANFFDMLSNNPDRPGFVGSNSGRLVDDPNQFVLFDNAPAFGMGPNKAEALAPSGITNVSDYTPSPKVLERARALTKEQLKSEIEELDDMQIEDLLERRNYYIGKIDNE